MPSNLLSVWQWDEVSDVRPRSVSCKAPYSVLYARGFLAVLFGGTAGFSLYSSAMRRVAAPQYFLHQYLAADRVISLTSLSACDPPDRHARCRARDEESTDNRGPRQPDESRVASLLGLCRSIEAPFFEALVPSERTLTRDPSGHIASSRIRIKRWCWRRSKTAFRTMDSYNLSPHTPSLLAWRPNFFRISADQIAKQS